MIESIIQPPNILPITLDQVKDNLRINTDAEDARLTSLIQSATSWVEGLTGKALIMQTRAVTENVTSAKLMRFIKQSRLFKIGLPTLPLMDIVEITSEGQPLTNYEIRESRLVVFIRPPHPGNITVVYRAGFGPDRDSVPPALRQTILIAVVKFYEELTFPLEKEVRSLIAPYRYSTIH